MPQNSMGPGNGGAASFATKGYVDAAAGGGGGGGPFLPLSGGALTGPLYFDNLADFGVFANTADRVFQWTLTVNDSYENATGIRFWVNASGPLMSLGPTGNLGVSGAIAVAGQVTLEAGNPVNALHAAPKQYVDAGDAALQAQIIPDAPSDGGFYARQNGAWVAITQANLPP
jgi:hypothetical protein